MSDNANQNQHGAHGSSNPQEVLNRTPALPKKRGRPARSVSPKMLTNCIDNKVGPSPKKIFKSGDDTTVPTNSKSSNPSTSRKVSFKTNRSQEKPDKTSLDDSKAYIDESMSDSDTGSLLNLHPSEVSLVSSNDSSEFDPSIITELGTATRKSNIHSSSHINKFDYSKITKNLPRFRGQDDDHFEAWMTNVRLFLREQCEHLTEHQKVTAVLLRIEGYPRFILSGKDFKSVKDIFKALKHTYGQDELTMLANIRQLPEESVRVYYSRLKTNLGLLGHHDTTKGKRIYLNYFLTGLLPRLKTQVENLMPQRLEDALAFAISFESKNAATDSKKSKKPNEDFTEKLNSFANQSEKSSESPVDKKINDRLNSMFGRLGEVINMIKHVDHSSGHNSNNANSSNHFSNGYNYRNHYTGNSFQNDRRNQQINNQYRSSARRSTQNRKTKKTHYSIFVRRRHDSVPNGRGSEFVCYGCNKKGHRYRYCPAISQNDKDNIANELRSQRNNGNRTSSINADSKLPLNSFQLRQQNQEASTE